MSIFPWEGAVYSGKIVSWATGYIPFSQPKSTSPAHYSSLPEFRWSSNSSSSVHPILGGGGGERARDDVLGDGRAAAAADGGAVAVGSRGSGAGRAVQPGRQLLPELRQGPHAPPLEPSHRRPRQDLQVPRPRGPRCPLFLVRTQARAPPSPPPCLPSLRRI